MVIFLLLSTNRNGFTVIELIAALGVTSMILLVVFSMFFLGFRAFEEGKQNIDLQQNVRLAADYISREVRYAQELNVVNPGEIHFLVHGNSNQYRIKQKGEELVVLTNFAENKIAYHIKTLEFTYCEQSRVLHYVIHGENGLRGYTLRSSLNIKN